MRTESNRQRRVGELLKRELAALVQRELHDPRVQGVTLTAVKVASDLSSATVYFTCLAGTQGAHAGAAALNRAAAFLRRQLRERLVLRGVPKLHFVYDESVEKGAALLGLIERAVAEDRKRKTD
jgi:ribosome-binding factor A